MLPRLLNMFVPGLGLAPVAQPLRGSDMARRIGDISKMQIERFDGDGSEAQDVASILAKSVGKPTEAAAIQMRGSLWEIETFR